MKRGMRRLGEEGGWKKKGKKERSTKRKRKKNREGSMKSFEKWSIGRKKKVENKEKWQSQAKVTVKIDQHLKVCKPTILPLKVKRIVKEVQIRTKNQNLLDSLVKKRKVFLKKEVRRITASKVKLNLLKSLAITWIN